MTDAAVASVIAPLLIVGGVIIALLGAFASSSAIGISRPDPVAINLGTIIAIVGLVLFLVRSST